MSDLIDSLIDRSKSARFTDSVYINHINNAIQDDFRDRTQNIKTTRMYSFESSEEVMRELYSLVVGPVNITPVGDTVPYPTDYRFIGRLQTTVDGITRTPKPMMFKMEGPALLDPFRKPKPTKPYYEELSSAFRILHGGTSFTNASFIYLKMPATVSMGQESDKVFGGGNVATNTQYIVYYDAVYNGNSYPSGSIFTSTLVTPLTSGTVIPTSVIVNTDMPEAIQYDLAKRAATTMELSVSELQKSQLQQAQSELD